MASRFTRFSLRTLLVAISAACVVMALVGYELEWIRRRRTFRAQHTAGYVESGHPRYPDDPFKERAPHLLWMFGEKGVFYFDIYVDEKDIKTKSDGSIYLDSSAREYIRTIHTLFPEARTYGVDDKGQVFSNMNWVWQWE